MTEQADRPARIRALAERVYIAWHAAGEDGSGPWQSELIWSEAAEWVDDFDRLEAEERAKGGGDE